MWVLVTKLTPSRLRSRHFPNWAFAPVPILLSNLKCLPFSCLSKLQPLPPHPRAFPYKSLSLSCIFFSIYCLQWFNPLSRQQEPTRERVADPALTQHRRNVNTTCFQKQKANCRAPTCNHFCFMGTGVDAAIYLLPYHWKCLTFLQEPLCLSGKTV